MTDDTTIVVVGGTSGLGREIAKKYADAGWSVVLTGRDAARAAAVAAELGGDARGLAVDLAEPETVADALRATSARSTTSSSPPSPGTRTPSRTTTSAPPATSR